MKRVWILTLLLALSAGGLCWAHADINQAREQVVLTETVLYGDPTAAEGLSVNQRTHYAHHLFWDTHHLLGEEPHTSTESSFSWKRVYERPTYTRSGVDLESYDFSEAIRPALEALQEVTSPGEEKEQIIYLKNYCEYYPLVVNLDFPNYSIDWDPNRWADRNNSANAVARQTVLDITDFFKIPVLEEHQMKIHFSKHADGSSVSRGMESTGEEIFALSTISVLTQDACYFTFDGHTSSGKLVNTSHIPGGYGLYCLPYGTAEGGEVPPATEDLAMVHPLNPEAELLKLSTNPAQTKLLLYTLENGTYVLTIIGIDTMETLQRLELFDAPEEYESWYLYEGDTYHVAALWDHQLALIAVTDTGDYELRFLAETLGAEAAMYQSGSYQTAMAYDGQRLAVSSTIRHQFLVDKNAHIYGADYTCGLHLAVYDETGLTYYGQHTSSLDTGTHLVVYDDSGRAQSYDYPCSPLDYNSLSMSWRE